MKGCGAEACLRVAARSVCLNCFAVVQALRIVSRELAALGPGASLQMQEPALLDFYHQVELAMEAPVGPRGRAGLPN